MSDIENKRIQQRHGTYYEGFQSDMFPYELLILDSGDPQDETEFTSSGKSLYFKTSNSVVRVRNADEPFELEEGQVDEDAIAGWAVTEDKIADNAIKTRHIASGQIKHEKLASNSVDTVNIVDRAVTEDKIKNGAVTKDKIDFKAVGRLQLDSNSVSADKIVNGAVDTDQLHSGAVTSGKLHTGAVTTNKIDAEAVTADKLDPSISTLLDTLSDFVPVISTSSAISDLSEGQLFIYNNNLARKTSSSYQYVNEISTTGGNVDAFTPYFIGQFRFINNKLYIGTSTQAGGYKEIELDNPTLKVQLTYDSTTEDLVADKSNKQIYDAMNAGRNVVVYYTTSTQTTYYKLNFSRTESVPQGTVYRISISDSYDEVDYYSYGIADDYARFVRE